MRNQSQPQRISLNTPGSELDIWLRDFLLDVHAANRSEATIGYYEDKRNPFPAFLPEQFFMHCRAPREMKKSPALSVLASR